MDKGNLEKTPVFFPLTKLWRCLVKILRSNDSWNKSELLLAAKEVDQNSTTWGGAKPVLDNVVDPALNLPFGNGLFILFLSLVYANITLW